MDIFNLPISWQIGVLVGLAALYAFLKGIELPKDYYKKQATRRELKQKIAELEQQQLLLNGESHENLKG
jgi:4-hydroxyphenylpyruvate dioxygenase-like putative hemolysin